MRRRAGVGKLLQKKREREQAAAKGQEIETQHLEHVESVLAEFKEHLESFASRHRDDINRVRAVVCARARVVRSRGCVPAGNRDADVPRATCVVEHPVCRTPSFGGSSSV